LLTGYAQVWDIQSFAKWIFSVKNADFHSHNQFFLDMRGLARSLKSASDQKDKSRYNDAELPDWKPLHDLVVDLVHQALQSESFLRIQQPVEFAWKGQAVLVLALQFCLPPMRGKPFWKLSMNPARGMSMQFPFKMETALLFSPRPLHYKGWECDPDYL
jgi:hypothetical protein